ncbi:MAG: hypothetical protein NTZ26_00360 [Candidatus Aminicenantes bacterium]|nr:hypothetical protein [Candidatus Aminicenantes bacterium]
MNPEKPSCPSNEAFEKSFRTDAPAAEREALVDHVRVCPPCRAKWDVLWELKREISGRRGKFERLAAASLDELRADGAPRATPGRLRFAWFRRSPAAAWGLLLALTVAAGLYFGPFAQRGDSLRSGETGGLVLLSPRGTIDGFPVEFRWSAPPSAESYFFELIDDRLMIIIPESGLNELSFSLPIGYESRFQKGRTYIWSVKATNDAGQTVGTSQQSFSIR